MATIQLDSTLERRESSLFGMWAFLATEVLFFGPLFFGYVHERIGAPDAFVAASHHMHIVLGTLNTALLMTSSLTMALAVFAAKEGKPLRLWLVLTASLGLVFLAIKGGEWAMEASEAASASGPELTFYFLYYTMTGLHGLHLVIGLSILAWLALRTATPSAVEVAGLYWHFVDLVWVFLYPMFYLLERYRA
jgi:cytochrome c oxidase subunit 3